MRATCKTFSGTLFAVTFAITAWSTIGHCLPVTQLTLIGGFSRNACLSVAAIMFVMYYAISLAGFEVAAGWLVGRAVAREDVRVRSLLVYTAAAASFLANAVLLCPAYQFSMGHEFKIDEDPSWLMLLLFSANLGGCAVLATAVRGVAVPYLRGLK